MREWFAGISLGERILFLVPLGDFACGGLLLRERIFLGATFRHWTTTWVITACRTLWTIRTALSSRAWG